MTSKVFTDPLPGQDAPDSKAKILIVEDDRDLNNLLRYNLESTQDYQVFSYFSGAGAYECLCEFGPDLVILDVMLPGLYGTEVLGMIRADERTRHIPVVLLTARSLEEDKVAGFEAGADDYITKPFSPKELLLRVQALLRRSQPARFPKESSKKELMISVGAIRILPEDFRVFVGEELVPLTPTEYQLLFFLAERVGRLQSRDALLQRVWGYEGNVNTRTVDTHVKRLRQKLGIAGVLIETVHGFGYRLVDNAQKTSQQNGATASIS